MKPKITRKHAFFISLCLALLTGCLWNTPGSLSDTRVPNQPNEIRNPTITRPPDDNPVIPPHLVPSSYSVSIDRMFSMLEGLTKIQSGAGYRTSGTDGELEALQFVRSELEELGYLQQLGIGYELQEFPIYIATEIYKSSLRIIIGDHSFSFSADAIRGWLNQPNEALPLDSDGTLNDTSSNPIIVSGETIMVLSYNDFQGIPASQYDQKIVLLSYALIDKSAGSAYFWDIIDTIFNANPKAVVLITENSDKAGESHGSFVNEEGPYADSPVPVIQIRLEDLKTAGIGVLNDLRQISQAEVTWDADVLSPAQSHNLIVHIPGTNPARAMIISAHIDSVGNPGAMDDGSGSVILMEIAHVLDENEIQPANDLYLVWYGSEELGLYGSAHFVNTHSELLDRAIANLQIDCLTRPMDGTQAFIQFAFWPQGGSDLESSNWVNAMQMISDDLGIETHKMILDMASDNGVMDGFNVPNFDLIYSSDDEMSAIGGIWYGGHIHDPYDSVETARDSSEAFEKMGTIALQAALLPPDFPEMRSVVTSGERIVIIATKNEPPLTYPINLREFGILMAQTGFDIDIIPYDTTFSLFDIADAAMVLLLPSMDYAGISNAVTSYDVSWEDSEIASVEQYVNDGGFLVLSNSEAVWGFYDYAMDINEDWSDMNIIAERFGITYDAYLSSSSSPSLQIGHPLTSNLTHLLPGSRYSVPFKMNEGTLLAGSSSAMMLGITSIGSNGGEVLVLADLAMLSRDWQSLMNRDFVANLSAFIQQR